MLDNLILNKKSIESIYKTICEFHEKYLKQFGVKLPSLLEVIIQIQMTSNKQDI